MHFLASETGPVVPQDVMNPTGKRLVAVTLDHGAFLGILREGKRRRRELVLKQKYIFFLKLRTG